MIYLLYATKVNVGGWTTFTKHLHDSLKAKGQTVELCKLGNNDEQFSRPFAQTDLRYFNVTLPHLLTALKNGAYVLVAAVGKHFVEEVAQLARAGAKVVVHDPAEPAFRMDIKNPWVIRKSMLEYAKDATFIRHPYIPVGGVLPANRTKQVVSTSRVDFDKNTTMILDANRLGAKIDIVGFENRLYAKFKIMPDYPEWEQTSGNRGMKDKSAYEYLKTALAMVDLTDIKGDGGGTQYTFLEAWDAGAIPIIGGWWIRSRDDMRPRVNCYTAMDGHTLNQEIKWMRKASSEDEINAIRSNGYKALKNHAPKVIVPQVMEWLNG